MVHIFRLGPLDVGGREAFAYAALSEDGPVVAPAVEHSEPRAWAPWRSASAGSSSDASPRLPTRRNASGSRRLRYRGGPSSRVRRWSSVSRSAPWATGWQEVVAAAAARPLPRLQNTDGEDFILTVDRFDVTSGKDEEVLAGLLALPDARLEEGEDGEGEGITVEFVKQENAKGVLPSTLVGRATIQGCSAPARDQLARARRPTARARGGAPRRKRVVPGP